jgi:hypothetical protein
VDPLYGHLRDRLFADQEMNRPIFIKDATIYEHPLFSVEYTPYNLRREQDVVHLKYGSEGIIVHSPTNPGSESWLYACVVAVYHAFVYADADPMAKRLELLWVRWMQRDTSHLSGPNAKRYPRVSFVPHSDVPGEAFGFVDPSRVIRGRHLLPASTLAKPAIGLAHRCSGTIRETGRPST